MSNRFLRNHPAPAGSLEEYLAVRLILKRLALQHLASEQFHYQGALKDLRSVLSQAVDAQKAPAFDHRAFVVFQLAQILGWFPGRLQKLTSTE